MALKRIVSVLADHQRAPWSLPSCTYGNPFNIFQ
jgi:hypothetical protein